MVYDPEGLNREEIVRLAKARSMIDNFDDSKLGPDGFRILVDENDRVRACSHVCAYSA